MPGPLSEEEKRIDRALDILETVRGGGVGSSVNITSNMTSIAPHTRGSGTRATTRPAALPVLAELEHRVRQARGGAALLARRTQVRTGAGAGAGSGRDPTPVTSVETRVTGPTMSFRSYMRGVGAGGGPRGGGETNGSPTAGQRQLLRRAVAAQARLWEWETRAHVPTGAGEEEIAEARAMM